MEEVKLIKYVFFMRAVSVNGAYGYAGKHVYLRANAKKFKKDISNALPPFPPKIFGPVKLKIRFYFKDKRKRDVDNYLKVFIDSVKNKLFEDDNEVEKIVVSKRSDCDCDKIKLIVYTYLTCSLYPKVVIETQK